MTDWHAWHDAYDRPGSTLTQRLAHVRDQIRSALDTLPPGPLSVISVCAGQGRDLIGALDGHPRAGDVQALLVELDERNAAIAREHAPAGVTVLTGDAALTDVYAGRAPAHLLLMCGVFGNISDADIKRTIAFCAQLCREDGFVIWTRHREAPDAVPWISREFEEAGFEEIWLSEPGFFTGVGVHRLRRPALALQPGERMFTFV